MTEIQCEFCGKKFNKTPSKISNSRHHFHSRECALAFRRQNEFEYNSHKINKEPHRKIRKWNHMRNSNNLNDFDSTARYIVQ